MNTQAATQSAAQIESAALADIQRREAVQPMLRHIFPTRPSMDWWIRVHRDELLKAGALVQIAGTVMIDVPCFTRMVREIGRRSAVARHQ